MIVDALVRFVADAAVWLIGLLPSAAPGSSGAAYHFQFVWIYLQDSVLDLKYVMTGASYFVPFREIFTIIGWFIPVYGFIIAYRFLLRIKPWG